QVVVRVGIFFLPLEDFHPRLDGPFGVLPLEASRLLLLFLKLCHGALKIPAPHRADKQNLLSRRRLRAVPPSSTRLPASPIRPSTPGPHETPARSGLGRRPGRAPPPR